MYSIPKHLEDGQNLAIDTHQRMAIGLHGTLAEILARRDAIRAHRDEAQQLWSWRHVADVTETLRKLDDLQRAVDLGVLNAEAPLFEVAKLGVFVAYCERYREAQEIVKAVAFGQSS